MTTTASTNAGLPAPQKTSDQTIAAAAAEAGTAGGDKN